MRVLIACERSGTVRDAFRALGHDAHSCDLEPCEGSGLHHIQLDALRVAVERGPWDLLIAHPPCTYLASSGLHWNKRIPGRAEETDKAMAFALRLWNLPIQRIAMENPIGRLTRLMRERGELVQTIQPYQFGHDASKATCLILSNLPPLRPTQFVEPRMVNGRPRWSNQTDSGQNRLAPSETRAIDRARTYPGIARAMAEQWGGIALQEAA